MPFVPFPAVSAGTGRNGPAFTPSRSVRNYVCGPPLAELLPPSRLMPLYRGTGWSTPCATAANAARHAQRCRLTAAPPTAGLGRGLRAAHDASTAKRSPKIRENSLRAVCQKGGGLRHLLSTPRNAR